MLWDAVLPVLGMSVELYLLKQINPRHRRTELRNRNIHKVHEDFEHCATTQCAHKIDFIPLKSHHFDAPTGLHTIRLV